MFSTQQYSGFDPRSIPGCSLWLDAADPNVFTFSSGNTISQWRDKSSNALIGNAGFGPSLTQNAQNGLPAVSFSASSSQYIDYTGSSVVPNLNQIHMFAVSKINNSNAAILTRDSVRGAYGLYRDANTLYSYIVSSTGSFTTASSSDSATTTRLFSGTWDRTTLRLIRNGTIVGSTARTDATNLSDAGALRIGGFNTLSSAYYLDGQVMEIIVYFSAVSVYSRQQIEGYLMWKWGINTDIPTSHPFRRAPVITRPFQPIDISACTLWLDAADSSTITLSSGVSQWRDKSGNMNDAVQATGSLQPTYANSSVTFNGSSHYMTLVSPSILPSGFTVTGTYFFVTRLTSSGSVGVFFMYGPNTPFTAQNPQFYYNTSSQLVVDVFGTGAITDTSNALNTTTILSSTISTTGTGTVTGWRNGISFGSNIYVKDAITPEQCLIGVSKLNTGALSFYYPGNINEIIIYNNILSTPQRQQIEGYLAAKWGLSSSLPTTQPFYLLRSIPSTPIFTPTSLSNCFLWLDGNDPTTVGVSGTNVTAWNDKSGTGNNLTTISATPPTYSSTTGAITFTAANQTAIRGALTSSITNPITTFVVCLITSPGVDGARNLLNFGTSGSSASFFAGQYNLVSTPTGSPAFFTYANNAQNPTGQGINVQTYIPTTYNTIGIFANSSTYSGTNLTNNTFLNGNTSTYSAVNTTWTVASPYVTTASYVAIGNDTAGTGGTGGSFNGNIYEVLAFSRTLSATERQQVEGYLAWKWGLQNTLPTTHRYYKFRP